MNSCPILSEISQRERDLLKPSGVLFEAIFAMRWEVDRKDKLFFLEVVTCLVL